MDSKKIQGFPQPAFYWRGEESCGFMVKVICTGQGCGLRYPIALARLVPMQKAK